MEVLRQKQVTARKDYPCDGCHEIMNELDDSGDSEDYEYCGGIKKGQSHYHWQMAMDGEIHSHRACERSDLALRKRK